MTGRERVEATLSGGSPELAAGVAYPEIPFRDRAPDHMQERWWILDEGAPERLNPAAARYLQRVNCDWWPVLWTAPREERERQEYLYEDGRDFVLDRTTGERRELHPPWAPQQADPGPKAQRDTLREEEYLERVAIVSAEQMLAEGRWELAADTVEQLGQQYWPYSYASVPFCRSFVKGFEQTMLDVAINPAFLHALADRLVAEQREYFRAMAQVGIRGLWVQDWYGGAELISRATYRDLVLPHGQDMFAEARRQGLVVMHYFMGDPSDRADLVAAMGGDILLFEEGRKGYGTSLEQLAPQLGREDVVLMDNLPSESVLAHAPEPELAAAIRRRVAWGRSRGRYLFSTGSPPTPETSLERIRLALDTAREAWRS